MNEFIEFICVHYQFVYNYLIVLRLKTDIHCPCYAEDAEGEYFGISNFTSVHEKCYSKEVESVLWDKVLKLPHATESEDKVNKVAHNIDSHIAIKDLKTATAETQNNALSNEISKTRTKLSKKVLLDMTKYIEDLMISEKNTGKVN